MFSTRDNIWGSVGLGLSFCDNVDIEYCEIFDTKVVHYVGNVEDYEGIDGVAIDLESDNTNITITNNYLHHNEGAGMLIYTNPGWGQGTSDNINVNENVFIDNGRKIIMDSVLEDDERIKPHPNNIHFDPHPLDQNDNYRHLTGEYKDNLSYVRSNLPSVDSQISPYAINGDNALHVSNDFGGKTNSNNDFGNNMTTGGNNDYWFLGSEWPAEGYFLWEFNTSGDDEGFEVNPYNNHIQNWNVSGGNLTGTINGVDPWFTSDPNDNLDIGQQSFKWAEIALQNNTNASSASLGFKRATDSSWPTMKWFSILSNEPDFTIYRVDMSTISSWDDVLKIFRIDPGEGASSGSFKIDYIRLANDTKLYRWDFRDENDYEQWEVANHIGYTEVGYGYYRGVVTGNDPYLVTPNDRKLNIPASDISQIKIRLRNKTESTSGTFWFKVRGQSNWQPGKWFSQSTLSEDFDIITIQTSSLHGWGGTIDQLRIDPCDLVSKPIYGGFEIDYIELIR